MCLVAEHRKMLFQVEYVIPGIALFAMTLLLYLFGTQTTGICS